ncbi:MAG: adenylate kinase family protein [Patescibacteria group bacterium]
MSSAESESSNLPTVYIFIGRSGCGKGTQAKMLSQRLQKTFDKDILYVETGQRLRKFIEDDSFSGNQAKQLMAEGKRLPAFLAVWTWAQFLIDQVKSSADWLLFDGTPRSLPEALALETALLFYGHTRVAVINLQVSREESVKRLTDRGRADDRQAELINSRLDWFDSDVAPVIERYYDEDLYTYIEIDGELSPEAIHELLWDYIRGEDKQG